MSSMKLKDSLRLVIFSARTQWREEGQNGVDANGEPIHGRHFCVFGDGIWYRHAPPKSTPWRVYLAVAKRLIRQQRPLIIDDLSDVSPWKQR